MRATCSIDMIASSDLLSDSSKNVTQQYTAWSRAGLNDHLLVKSCNFSPTQQLPPLASTSITSYVHLARLIVWTINAWLVGYDFLQGMRAMIVI
jgi:hypothetical protein